MTPFETIKYYVHEVVMFLAVDIQSLFPYQILEWLFFVPAITMVIAVIRYFRNSFRG